MRPYPDPERCAYCQAEHLATDEETFASGIVLGIMIARSPASALKLRSGFCIKHDGFARAVGTELAGFAGVADA